MGSRIGSYVVHYADGQSWEVPIVYGVHVHDWWGNPRSAPAPSAPVPAWTGRNPSLPAGLQLQVFLTTWTNPLPQLKITAIDFKGVPSSRSHPFLLGLTLQPADPAGPPP